MCRSVFALSAYRKDCFGHGTLYGIDEQEQFKGLAIGTTRSSPVNKVVFCFLFHKLMFICIVFIR